MPNFSLKRLLPIILTIWGVIGIIHQIYLIFVEFPHLPEIFAASGYSTNLYRGWLYRTFLMSLESLITAAFGLSMMIKPSYLIKKAHLVLGIGIGVASIVVRLIMF